MDGILSIAKSSTRAAIMLFSNEKNAKFFRNYRHNAKKQFHTDELESLLIDQKTA